MQGSRASWTSRTAAAVRSRQQWPRGSLRAVLLSTVLFLSGMTRTGLAADPNYSDALSKLILYFEGQRSGQLNLATLRNTWRSHSGLQDGSAQGVSTRAGLKEYRSLRTAPIAFRDSGFVAATTGWATRLLFSLVSLSSQWQNNLRTLCYSASSSARSSSAYISSAHV